MSLNAASRRLFKVTSFHKWYLRVKGSKEYIDRIPRLTENVLFDVQVMSEMAPQQLLSMQLRTGLIKTKVWHN